LKWPLVVLLVLFVAALFWAREQAETLLFGLRLLEFGAALAVLLAAAYGGLVYQDQRRLAAREIAQSAAADDWNPERLRRRVESLAEPYWRAVAAGDIGPLADCLSEDWRSLSGRAPGRLANEPDAPGAARFRPRCDGSWVAGLADGASRPGDRACRCADLLPRQPSAERRTGRGHRHLRPEQQPGPWRAASRTG
jgi:hypothetical protein